MPPKTKATAEQVAAERVQVDLDLDVIRPRGGSFRHGGVVYYTPAEVPIPVVLEALQMREKAEELELLAASGDESAIDGIHAGLAREYELVMSMLRSVNDHLPEDGLSLGRSEINSIFGLCMSGGLDADSGLRAQIAQAIAGGGADVDDDDDEDEPVTSLPPTRPKPGGGSKAAGRSAARSRSKSSG